MSAHKKKNSLHERPIRLPTASDVARRPGVARRGCEGFEGRNVQQIPRIYWATARLARSPWTVLQAGLTTFLVLAVAALAGAECARLAVSVAGSTHGHPAATLAGLAGFQLTAIALVLIASFAIGGRPATVLALRMPFGGARALMAALAGLGVFAVIYAGIVLLLDPDAVARDLAPAAALLRSDYRVVALILLGIGAPLAEELLLRGVLFPALAQSRLGLAGAAIASSLAWTALHAGYSAYGLVEVFLIGLYFCWLLAWTGSLWVPIIGHGVYNTALALALDWLPVSL